MYNYYNKRKYIFSIFLILILVIGVGYAYLTSNLSISGNTSVSTNSWNIHFENIQVKDGSVTATTSPTLSNNNTSITYTIDLNRPKEYYEFTVDVKNDGTLPGKVSISELSGISAEAQAIIDYNVTYKSGRTVAIGDILNAGDKKTIRVRVFYKDEINPEDFPANNLSLTLTYTLQYIQSEEDGLPNLIDTIIELSETNSCLQKYEGEVTDVVRQTKRASNVYINKCLNKRYVVFGGFCWVAFRTTDDSGIKMIYNGESANGKCEFSVDNHKGIVRTEIGTQTINSSYTYGDSFTYDTTTNEFTLVNTTTATWSDSTYEDIIGKYTCKTSSNTCTTLYNVNNYYSNTQAYMSAYEIGDTHFDQIGTSSFNAYDRSVAMVGYMFNKVYGLKGKSIYISGPVNYKLGSSFTYENGMYTLSGDVENVESWPSGYSSSKNHHYTCWNSSGICYTISYISAASTIDATYIDITDGKGVDEVLEEMLSVDNVNRYNSSIKGIVDSWYAQNLLDKTSMIDDSVYCNNRSITNLGGYNVNGGDITGSEHFLRFKNNNQTTDLSCLNETDQFSVSNNKAKLTYPVSLLQHEELKLSSIFAIGGGNTTQWTLSPSFVNYQGARVLFLDGGGSYDNYSASSSHGIRPVITLKPSVKVSSGTGSESKPWIVE